MSKTNQRHLHIGFNDYTEAFKLVTYNQQAIYQELNVRLNFLQMKKF